MKIDNFHIIHKLKEGDQLIFDQVYRDYYRGLCAFASQYVTDVAECEEIVQDTMMWLWENREVLLPDMSLRSLLFTIVKNKCLNSISHTRIKQQVHEALYEKFSRQFEDPEFYVEGELLNLLEKAIKGLPEDYRNAFEMNRFQNYTYDEIAEKAGVSSKTIAYRISQALKLLRKELKDYSYILLFL